MKKMMLTMIFPFVLISACSSSKKDDRELEEREHEDIEREYVVTNASSKIRPGWIEDAEVWARNHSKETKVYRYFSYETDPGVSRSVSCEKAKARAKSDIAGEITTFIDRSLGQSRGGQSTIDENNPRVQALREYVESTLTEKVQALIHGASIEKTYWEKRKYLKKLGAKRDFKAYTCAVFVRMPVKNLNRAIDEASMHVSKQADDPETKEIVKNALKDAKENFNKAKRGEI